MVDLADHSLTEISADWDIDHAMNAHFSPDGSQIVFMGDQRGGDRDWDVFLWTIGSAEPPENLTEDWGTRDEDPKFTPAGTIVCKSNYDLIELDTSGSVVATLTSDGMSIEQSMPFATTDGSQFIYAQGAGKTSDLHLIRRNGTGDTVVQGAKDVQEYYPIVRDAETYLFTRWVSTTNVHDQVYLGHWDGTPALALPLNDESSNNSDASPYGADAVFVSSTRRGGVGGYDLYVAGIDSASMVSLSEWSPEINTAQDELGAVFFR
jgi:Tol biopolymer transport system component